MSSGGASTLKLTIFLEWAKPPLRIAVGEEFPEPLFCSR
jgi:hypothetical protein